MDGQETVTCIAWDGRELAGDRLGDWNGTRVRLRKVWRVRDKEGRPWLLGGSGEMDCMMQYLEWFQGKAVKPEFTKDDSLSVLLVNQRGQIMLVNRTLARVPLRQKIAAVGSARGEALAAMACGKSAREAVRIASRLEVSVGMGVDVVRF